MEGSTCITVYNRNNVRLAQLCTGSEQDKTGPGLGPGDEKVHPALQVNHRPIVGNHTHIIVTSHLRDIAMPKKSPGKSAL